MMLVTGNNTITEAVAHKSRLSIQLSLDGLSFFVSGQQDTDAPIHCVGEYPLDSTQEVLPQVQALFEQEPLFGMNYAQVAVILDTDRVCLMPAVLYEKSEAKSFLKANGIDKHEHEKCIVSPEYGDVLALMTCSKPLYKYLQGYFQTHLPVVYLHPLLVNIGKPIARPRLELNLSKGFAHVTFRDEQLRFAETLPYRSLADLLFILHQLDKNFPTKEADLIIVGVQAEVCCKDVHPYFKQASIDKQWAKYLPKGVDYTKYNNLICASHENY